MGCNCKKNINPAYAEVNNNEETKISVLGVVSKMGTVIGQLFFGLVTIVVLLIGLVPFLCYLMFCLCTGKEMSVRIPDLTKLKK